MRRCNGHGHGHGSWVTHGSCGSWVNCMCDGSHGSWITKDDPFPSLVYSSYRPNIGLRLTGGCRLTTSARNSRIVWRKTSSDEFPPPSKFFCTRNVVFSVIICHIAIAITRVCLSTLSVCLSSFLQLQFSSSFDETLHVTFIMIDWLILWLIDIYVSVIAKLMRSVIFLVKLLCTYVCTVVWNPRSSALGVKIRLFLPIFPQFFPPRSDNLFIIRIVHGVQKSIKA